ncbi:MAG: glycosyltransferase family 4 protein [Spirochaetaceae bacterium]|nr:glycosyltransferase family 4 protein [Spirochaetaceae bacterium]
MRILIAAHALVIKEYQKFIDYIVQEKNDVLLITPAKYKESGKDVCVDYNISNYKHIAVDTILGKEGKQHLFFYLLNKYVKDEIKKFNPEILYLYEEPCSTVTRQFIRAIKKLVRNIKIVLWTSDNVNRNYIKEKGWFDPRGYWFTLNQRYSYLNSDGIIATTRDSLSVLREKKYPKKIFLSSTHFINSEIFFSHSSLQGIKNEKEKNIFYLGYIGRFVKYKNIEVVIKAMNVVAEKIDNIKLILIGEGPEKENYISLVNEYSLENKIEITPFVKYNKIPEILNSFSLFILPSSDYNGVSEKFGRVVIEAMSCGVPVIVSDQGYLPVLAENAGTVFKADDHNELALKIIELYNNKSLREEMALKGMKKVNTLYSAEKTAERFIKIFKILLENHNEKEFHLGPF